LAKDEKRAAEKALDHPQYRSLSEAVRRMNNCYAFAGPERNSVMEEPKEPLNFNVRKLNQLKYPSTPA
jgi:hypothetical protein